MSVNNSTANNSATPKPKISTTERVIKSKYSSSGLSSHFQTGKSKARNECWSLFSKSDSWNCMNLQGSPFLLTVLLSPSQIPSGFPCIISNFPQVRSGLIPRIGFPRLSFASSIVKLRRRNKIYYFGNTEVHLYFFLLRFWDVNCLLAPLFVAPDHSESSLNSCFSIETTLLWLIIYNQHYSKIDENNLNTLTQASPSPPPTSSPWPRCSTPEPTSRSPRCWSSISSWRADWTSTPPWRSSMKAPHCWEPRRRWLSLRLLSLVILIFVLNMRILHDNLQFAVISTASSTTLWSCSRLEGLLPPPNTCSSVTTWTGVTSA